MTTTHPNRRPTAINPQVQRRCKACNALVDPVKVAVRFNGGHTIFAGHHWGCPVCGIVDVDHVVMGIAPRTNTNPIPKEKTK